MGNGIAKTYPEGLSGDRGQRYPSPKKRLHHKDLQWRKDGSLPLGIPCLVGAPRKRGSKGRDQGGGGAARSLSSMGGRGHISDRVFGF